LTLWFIGILSYFQKNPKSDVIFFHICWYPSHIGLYLGQGLYPRPSL